MSGMNLGAYFGWTLGAVILGGICFWIAGNRLSAGCRMRILALALPLGILGARAFYVLARLGFFMEIGGMTWLWPADPMWSDWGVGLGFALWGAIGGAALAGWIGSGGLKRKQGRAYTRESERDAGQQGYAANSGKLKGEEYARGPEGNTGKRGQARAAIRESSLPGWALDALALGGCLAIGLYRFSEFLIGEGMGPYVETDWLCFFPVALMNEWEEWYYAVFIYEGLAALIIFAVLWFGRKKRAPGDTARAFMILFCSCQILLESLRRDSFLRWMFVRVSQVTAAGMLGVILAAAAIRIHRNAKEWEARKKEIIVCCALYALFVLLCIGLEFAMDKSATLSLEVCYATEALCCIGMGTAVWRISMPRRSM